MLSWSLLSHLTRAEHAPNARTYLEEYLQVSAAQPKQNVPIPSGTNWNFTSLDTLQGFTFTGWFPPSHCMVCCVGRTYRWLMLRYKIMRDLEPAEGTEMGVALRQFRKHSIDMWICDTCVHDIRSIRSRWGICPSRTHVSLVHHLCLVLCHRRRRSHRTLGVPRSGFIGRSDRGADQSNEAADAPSQVPFHNTRVQQDSGIVCFKLFHRFAWEINLIASWFYDASIATNLLICSSWGTDWTQSLEEFQACFIEGTCSKCIITTFCRIQFKTSRFTAA